MSHQFFKIFKLNLGQTDGFLEQILLTVLIREHNLDWIAYKFNKNLIN